MSETDDSTGKRPRISDAAKAAFIDAARAGARVSDAAKAAGHSLPGFGKVARREAAFRAGWEAAAAAAEGAAMLGRMEGALRAVGGAHDNAVTPSVAGPLHRGSCGSPPRAGEKPASRIACNNQRIVQRRRMAHVRFDAERQAAFLARFRESCDATWAAAAAGVSESTIFHKRTRDSAFAAAFQAALEEGYARLSAEALRQRLAAQRRLRAALEGVREEEAPGAAAGELAEDFERSMKLLARWDCGREPPGPRRVSYGRQKAMSFEQAIVLLDKKLHALGVRRGLIRPPPPARDEED